MLKKPAILKQTRKEKLTSLNETVSMLLEFGKRWYEDYHGRAYKAGLVASPEKVKQATGILRQQMKKHNASANRHQDIAHGIVDKYEVDKFKDIPDQHDRLRAFYHSAQSDHYRRKEMGAFWAHSGIRKAAQERGLLKNDPEKGHYAAFKD